MEDGRLELMNNTGYIKLDSDDWSDAGKIYKVLEYFRRDVNSTSVHLTLEHENGLVEGRVVPLHWIEWIEDGDW